LQAREQGATARETGRGRGKEKGGVANEEKGSEGRERERKEGGESSGRGEREVGSRVRFLAPLEMWVCEHT
jgi:hypothetical protein